MTQRSLSKLGAHCIGGSADAVRLLRDGLSPVVKVMNSWTGIADIAAALPHQPVVVGRKYQEPWDPPALFREGRDAIEMARAYVAAMEQEVKSSPSITAWEGPNEPVFGDGMVWENQRAMQWYATFESERARVLREVFGKGAVVGNFATGNPDLPEKSRMALWGMFRPAIDAVNRYQGFLGLHEYWQYQRQGNEHWDTWLPLRYRHVGNWLGAAMPRTIITECGWDSLPGTPPGRPFHASGRSVKDYLNSLVWYDQELNKDAYVVGATIFTFGSDWDSHNVEGDGLADLLIAYARQSLYDDAAPSPAPERPAPVPPPVSDLPKRVRLKPNPSWGCVWNVRSRPVLDDPAAVVTQLPSGDELKVLAAQGDFYQIAAAGAYRGWRMTALFIWKGACEVVS